jgi:AraC-like DNA-binding protein
MGEGDEFGYRERRGRHAAIAAVWSSAARGSGAALVAADGCFDLIVRVPERGRASAFVYRPLARAHQAPVVAGDRHVGVRLHAGFGAVFGAPGPLIRAAEQLTSGCGDDLETLVVHVLEGLPRRPNVVSDFVAEARAAAGALRLTKGTSAARERELQRACRTWLGLSPKEFLRIERVWAARAAIPAGGPLAAIAADLGYADQAHLSREVRRLLGVTPRELRSVGFLQDLALPAR